MSSEEKAIVIRGLKKQTAMDISTTMAKKSTKKSTKKAVSKLTVADL